MKLQPVVAGSFYPGDREELQAILGTFDRKNPTMFDDNPVALLLPHAGYIYSGAVAALGYRSLPSSVKTVIVVGPSHYVPFQGVSLFAGEAVVTPLGELAVDQEACRFLMEFDSHIAEIPPAFAREHSVEVHFPLVRHYLKGAKVVPIIMGQGEEQAVRPLARALLALWEKKPFLLVASSDLSHYPAYDVAKKADGEFLEALLTGDEKAVEKADRKIMACGYPEYYCTHCGREPVEVLLKFAHGVGARKTRLLDQRNSGDVTGDRTKVVGYAAVAFSKGS
jgi:MEMO1 family protein